MASSDANLQDLCRYMLPHGDAAQMTCQIRIVVEYARLCPTPRSVTDCLLSSLRKRRASDVPVKDQVEVYGSGDPDSIKLASRFDLLLWLVC